MGDNYKGEIPFSNLNRGDRLSSCENHEFDLIIIGGGVTGAGIALDASLRGLSTLLLEKKDFASGTSSKSTKLIHGGLRYLKQFEIGLVKESGLERAVAHANIPHLVHPEKMLLPIVHNGTFGKLMASMAISVYDLLAKVRPSDRKQTFNKQETLEIEPLFKPSVLKSSIQYSEYRTDDARLTMELIKASKRQGAEAFNYLEVIDFIYDEKQVVGVNCKDLVADSVLNFKAQQIVSAAGPWVDDLRDTNKSKKGNTLQLTKGVHIVIPRDLLPVESAVYFDAFDGRMLFAIPRGKVTYVGTSDTKYETDKDRVLCTIADAEYILKAVNLMFEVDTIKPEHIISSWAGLRPLIHEEGKSPSDLSRKDEIFISDSNLISIAGGKLTGFRKMAERIVDLVLDRNSSFSDVDCKTENFKIHSNSFDDYGEFVKFKSDVLSDYKSKGLNRYDAWYLTTTYGKHSRCIIDAALKYDLELAQALIKSEIQYCIEFESCYLPDDFFNRRTGRIYFFIESVVEHLDFIIDEFQSYYNWDADRLEEIRKESQVYLDDVMVLR